MSALPCVVSNDLARHFGEQAAQDSFNRAVERKAHDMLGRAIDLAEAAEHVLGFTSWSDHAAQDIAALMLCNAADQDARDLEFVRDLRRRVEDRIREVAAEEVDNEAERRVMELDEFRNGGLL